VGLPDTDLLAVRAVAPASFWVAVVGQGEGAADEPVGLALALLSQPVESAR